MCTYSIPLDSSYYVRYYALWLKSRAAGGMPEMEMEGYIEG